MSAYSTAPSRRNPAAALAAIVAIGFASVTLAWLALRMPMLAAGAIYAAAFIALAWTKPSIALMLTFASGPLQNDMSGGGPARFSVAEINLALMAAVFALQAVVRKSRVTMGPLVWPVAFYLSICIVSSLYEFRGKDAVVSLLQMVLYLVVTVVLFSSYARSPKEVLPALYGLVIVGVAFSLIGFLTGSNYFLGIHKNGIGGSLFTAFVVALELWLAADSPGRKRLLGIALLIITAGLVNTLSRGAWLAAAVGVLLILLLRRERRIVLNLLLLMIPATFLAWALVPAEQKSYATDIQIKETGSFGSRLANARIAQSYIEKNAWLGQGVGLRKQHDATNVLLFTLAETGILGLAGFLAIHAVFFGMIWRTHRLLDPRDPAFSCLAIGGALVLGKLTHGQLDHYWSRGTVMMAWSAAGMAVLAFRLAQERNKRSHLECG